MGYWENRRTSGSGFGNSQQNYGGWGQTGSFVPRDPTDQGFGQGQRNSEGDLWYGPNEGGNVGNLTDDQNRFAFANYMQENRPQDWENMMNDPTIRDFWSPYFRAQQPNQNMAGNIMGSMMNPQGLGG